MRGHYVLDAFLVLVADFHSLRLLEESVPPSVDSREFVLVNAFVEENEGLIQLAVEEIVDGGLVVADQKFLVREKVLFYVGQDEGIHFLPAFADGFFSLLFLLFFMFLIFAKTHYFHQFEFLHFS